MTHDEIGIIAEESQAVEIAQLLIEIVKQQFQIYVPDYLPDSEDPKKHIGLSWGHVK